MRHVRLTVRARQDTVHPVFDLLTRSQHVEEVLGLHWNFSGDRLGTLHYVVGDVEAYVAELESIPEVLDHDVAETGEGTFYVYHRCVTDGAAKALFETFTRGSLLLVPPIEFGRGGTATFSLFGDAAEIQAAIEAVPDPVDVAIREIGGMSSTPRVAGATLSDRQREAIDVALSLGYYEIPREASHEDVAAAMGCAPSTAAEHLRKAEAKALRSTFDDGSAKLSR